VPRLDLGDPDGNAATITSIDGDLPDGIRLDPDGTFRGTSTTPGSYEVTLTICDDGQPRMCVTQDLLITVTDNELAHTGSESLLMIRFASLLVLAGLALFLAGRRRRREA
jgi:LPXTG-motif cell wall-anchored protein